MKSCYGGRSRKHESPKQRCLFPEFQLLAVSDFKPCSGQPITRSRLAGQGASSVGRLIVQFTYQGCQCCEMLQLARSSIKVNERMRVSGSFLLRYFTKLSGLARRDRVFHRFLRVASKSDCFVAPVENLPKPVDNLWRRCGNIKIICGKLGESVGKTGGIDKICKL